MSGNLSTAGVEETLKDFWASRPRRPQAGRKIAGVAAGIGERYRIDPVIVRIAFVAMALCNGAGFLIYLLGWLWLAQSDDQVSPAEALLGRGRSSTPTPLTILLGLAVFPATGFFVDGGFTMVAGVLLSVGGVYLLHRNRGALNRPAPTPEVTMDQSADGRTDRHATVPPTATPSGPPAWDPLGAAPFAWDLPEPTPAVVYEPPPPPVRRRRSRVGKVTFGLVMLVVAGSAIASDSAAWFTAPHVLGLVVAVLGLGLVVGAFRGGARGLIWLVVPLALAGVGMTSIDGSSFGSERIGDYRDTPTSIEQVQPRYDTNAGEVVVDLRELPTTGSVRTTVEVGVGTAQVFVPENADVTVTCAAELGSFDCLDHKQDGADREQRVVDSGADGPGGLKIELDVRAGVGEVMVTRG
ncbi:PspC domain-containing protein [Saccharothrix violaceirubra]|uniref:Phage shock protein PspC (Stress-responsive transcriptional regulator) n=1 Tax=Saccharothrix violaceirubra TaxID=413306 RepID=A0A7W7SZ13_9PSEU|nr:PspC domain-containing protein [Saccharothrix violaceirubra]MBB4962967.1 phage shock protein PspC (stress-responsive transcriptional regulator) [Saccharothrix violaceirubra]